MLFQILIAIERKWLILSIKVCANLTLHLFCRVRHVYPCQEVQETPGNIINEGSDTEDDCLNRCLMDRFTGAFGCVHARLKHLKHLRPALDYCKHKDLSFANATERDVDPGVIEIHRILEGFDDTLDDDERRCHCPRPCRRRRITLNTWKAQKWDAERKEVFAFFGVMCCLSLITLDTNCGFFPLSCSSQRT